MFCLMKNILYWKDYDKKLNAICKWWLDSLWVLADFDKTFTKAFADWKNRGALIWILGQKWYISTHVKEKWQESFEKYYPIEIDPLIPIEEKKKYMQEWWENTFQLLIEDWLSKYAISNAMCDGWVCLRFGVKRFFQLLSLFNVPLIILSSGWLGGYAIHEYLNRRHLLRSNVRIVWNELIWDEQWIFVDYKKPIIHSMNKDGSSIPRDIMRNQIGKRKNILLLGDSIADINMANNCSYEEILKIWFLNENKWNRLQQYRENFDIVIVNDWTFCNINKVLKKIILW